MVFIALTVVIVIGIATPFFLVVFIPLSMKKKLLLSLIFCLVFFYRQIQKYYLRSSRELKRLESITRSPIYSQFSGRFPPQK